MRGWLWLVNPHGLVNGILYSTQFVKTLDDEAVEWIARALLEEPIMHLSPEQEYDAIVAALRSDEPLTGRIPQPHDESTVREFLGRVVRRLDALRPWPELPFVRLSPDHRTEFEGTRPIARVRVPILDIQTRLRDLFHRLDDSRTDVNPTSWRGCGRLCRPIAGSARSSTTASSPLGSTALTWRAASARRTCSPATGGWPRPGIDGRRTAEEWGGIPPM